MARGKKATTSASLHKGGKEKRGNISMGEVKKDNWGGVPGGGVGACEYVNGGGEKSQGKKEI